MVVLIDPENETDNLAPAPEVRAVDVSPQSRSIPCFAEAGHAERDLAMI
jgi:hypothetical protein